MKLTIKSRLIVSFSIITAVIIFLGVFSFISTNKLKTANDEQQLRVQQILLAKDYAKIAQGIVLTAMDIIVDRENKSVEKERTDDLKASFALLKNYVSKANKGGRYPC